MSDPSNRETINLLRTEWSSFFKWTVSISIFLITASLTTTAFQIEVFKKTLTTFNWASISITVGILLINVVSTWGILALNVFEILKFMADLPVLLLFYHEKKGNADIEEKVNRYETAVKFSKPIQRISLYSFMAGFIAFIVFLFSLIL